VDVPTDASPRLFDEAGVIVADTACRRCSYNLRGLHQDGRCPECGTPIGLSTHGDLLRFADPEWLEKLALGVKYIIWAVVLSIALSLAGGCVGGALGGSPVFLQGVMILGSLLGLYGAWLLTAPDPSGIGEERYLTYRKVVRFALLVGVLSTLAHFAIQALPKMPTSLYTVIVIGGVLAGLIGVVGEFAKFSYVGMLADRIPAPNLAGWARFLRWALAASTALAAVSGAVMALVLAPTRGGAGAPNSSAPSAATQTGFAAWAGSFGGSGMMAAVCVIVTLGLAVLVFEVMAFILYVRLGRRFREQAGIARGTWAAATAPGQSGLPAAPARFQHPHEHDR